MPTRKIVSYIIIIIIIIIVCIVISHVRISQSIFNPMLQIYTITNLSILFQFIACVSNIFYVNPALYISIIHTHGHGPD